MKVEVSVLQLKRFINKLKNIQTAYSVDKVVEELEEVHNKFCNSVVCKSMCGDCVEYIMFNKNIEIVKQGGVRKDVE